MGTTIFFMKVNSSKKSAPHHIHYPFFIDFDSFTGTGCHSTDPFVFDKFYYAHCLQDYNTLGRPKPLRKYLTDSNLSLILLGYEYPFGSLSVTDFILDTVIVIDKGKLISSPSHIFQLSNLRFTNSSNSLYVGKNLDINSMSIFSFSPCKSISTGLLFRNYLSLSISKFNLKTPGARTGGKDLNKPSYANDDRTYYCDDNNVIEFWIKLVNELFRNNISLAVQINEPELFNDYISAFNHFNTNIISEMKSFIDKHK